MATKLINKTWWGQEFVQALETHIDPGRLQRGKAYRTDNRVLDFAIKGSEVTATMRGNVNPYFGVTKEPRYKVVLKFDQIKPAQWQRIIKNISSNALWLSKLMLNEIPINIADAFDGKHLLPLSYDSVNASCSCPDYSVPCKHIAGCYYRTASMLDSDPMLLFQLRGLAPTKLHEELKTTELGKAFSEHLTVPESVEMQYQEHMYTPTHVKRSTAKRTQKKSSTPALQAARLNQFWSAPLNVTDNDQDEATQEKDWFLERSGNDNVSEISAALIKKQGDYPEFWTGDDSFISAMESFYSHTRKKNIKDLM